MRSTTSLGAQCNDVSHRCNGVYQPFTQPRAPICVKLLSPMLFAGCLHQPIRLGKTRRGIRLRPEGKADSHENRAKESTDEHDAPMRSAISQIK